MGETSVKCFSRQPCKSGWIFRLRELQTRNEFSRNWSLSRTTLHDKFCSQRGSSWNWPWIGFRLEGNVIEIVSNSTDWNHFTRRFSLQRCHCEKQQLQLSTWFLFACFLLFTSCSQLHKSIFVISWFRWIRDKMPNKWSSSFWSSRHYCDVRWSSLQSVESSLSFSLFSVSFSPFSDYF